MQRFKLAVGMWKGYNLSMYNVYERGIFLSKMEILTELGPELGAEPPRIYNFVECPPLPSLPPRERRKKSVTVIGRLWSNVPNLTVTAYKGFHWWISVDEQLI